MLIERVANWLRQRHINILCVAALVLMSADTDYSVLVMVGWWFQPVLWLRVIEDDAVREYHALRIPESLK